jgi:hypothetical protein
MQCARAFGALITMRDDPMDAPIPDEFKPSSYDKERLKEVSADLVELDTMTDEEVTIASRKDFDDEMRHFNERSEEIIQQRTRYEAMILKVFEWTPPTEEHVELKNFMISQLRESIKFDCSHMPEMPSPKTPTEWLNERRGKLKREVEYYEKSSREETERAEKQTAWVRDLRKSLAENNK